MKSRVGMLLSGNLGLISLKHIFSRCDVIFVFTDKKSNGIIDECKLLSIPCFIGNPRILGTDVDIFLEHKSVDYIISVNYLFVVQKKILQHPKYFPINIHGSLLPQYRGRTPHVWAIINGEKNTGITVHKMDEECDTGDIIFQEKVEITSVATGADILNKYSLEYPKLLDRLINVFQTGDIIFTPQENSEATYFGKRTPEDGEINWNWQKERIHNWVRALSFPYPGAFTFYRGSKIIIDEIKFSTLGYSYDIPNGEIIKVGEHPFVKTPNGVIEIEKVRDLAIKFESNTMFEAAL